MKLMGVENPKLEFEETIMEAYENRLAEFKSKRVSEQGH